MIDQISEPLHSEISVDELMLRIRAEIENRRTTQSSAAVQAAGPLTLALATAAEIHPVGNTASPSPVALQLREPDELPVQPRFQADDGNRHHINDLMSYHDQTFVFAAYQTLLRRAPDKDGLHHYLDKLRKGSSRIEILGNIHYSQEGRRIGVSIAGLALPYALHKASRFPVIGGPVRFAISIWNLPKLQHRQRIMENQIIQFAEQSAIRTEEALRSIHKALRELECTCNQTLAYAATKSSHDALQAVLASKAERHELTTLNNHLVVLLETRLSKEEIAPIEESLTALTESIALIKQVKADRVTVETSQAKAISTLNMALDNFKHTIESLSADKVDRQELAAAQQGTSDNFEEALDRVRQSVQSLSDTKADRSTVETTRAEVNTALNSVQQQAAAAFELASDPLSTQTPRHTRDGLDSMYARFEEEFRGTREDVRRRQEIYLPYVRYNSVKPTKGPVIDLGCGRGEWLELLRNEGITAYGVDLNCVFLESCRQLGLDVTEQDAIEFLHSIEPNSVSAVTAFHLIEHLPFDTLITLFDEALRILSPGGIAIFETPNPRNILVGSCTFYLDPTHRNPLPPELTQHMLVDRGFKNVSILELHPFPEELLVTDGTPRINQILNQNFFGPRDYAVIATKGLGQDED
jgi:SAM-dependent methyltransferase